jgi:hypothetical protein
VTRQTLTQAQLKRSVLGEGDSRRFDLTDLSSMPDLDTRGARLACGSVGLAYALRTKPQAESQRLVGAFDQRKQKPRPGTLMMAVQAHDYADARAVLRNFRADLADCPGYRGKDGAEWKVTRYRDPESLGDEAAAYRVVNKTDAKHPRSSGQAFTVARAGSVVLLSYGSIGGPHLEMEPPTRKALQSLLREQIARLPHTG